MMGKTHMIAGIGAAVLISPLILSAAAFRLFRRSSGWTDLRSGRTVQHLLPGCAGREKYSPAFRGCDLILDWKWSTGIWDHIGSHLGSRQLLGLGIFSGDNHCRKAVLPQKLYPFFPGTGVLMAAFYFLYAPLIPYVAAGFLSHMFLDLLNKSR